MATITCGKCQKRYKVEARLAGKSVKCKACGNVLHIPAVEGGDGAGEMPLVAAAGDPPCPGCGKPLPAMNKVCVKCGFNRATGQKVGGAVGGAPVAARPASQPSMLAPRDEEASGVRPNEPYASPHVALLDQWGTNILFFVGLAAVCYPAVCFLIRYMTLPPLPPGTWKAMAVQLLVYVACGGLMLGVWGILVAIMKALGKALKFELPEQPFKRLVAVCAVPLLAWGVSYHCLFQWSVNAMIHPAPVQFAPPAPGRMPPSMNMKPTDSVASIALRTSLESTAIAEVLAAGAFFFFYRLKKLDLVFCGVLTLFLFAGILMGETFFIGLMNKEVVTPVQKSVNTDLQSLSQADRDAYMEKLKTYIMDHPNALNELGMSLREQIAILQHLSPADQIAYSEKQQAYLKDHPDAQGDGMKSPVERAAASWQLP